MLAATSVSAQAQSSAPLQLRPTDSWTADFADESCALRRSFSDGTTTVVFELGQYAPGSWLQVAVASATLDPRRRAPHTGFLPGDGAIEAKFYRPFTSEGGLTGFAVDDTMLVGDDLERARADEDFIWPADARDKREQAITGYSVSQAFRDDLVLLTGPLHEPMKVMRTCLDDLLTRWGLDAAAHRTLSRRAGVDFDTAWFRRMAQMQGTLLDNRAGTVLARLLVDEAGKVTGCRLLNLPPDTDDAIEFCGEMEQRAQLRPALDSGGRPIKSFYIWQITRVVRQQF